MLRILRAVIKTTAVPMKSIVVVSALVDQAINPKKIAPAVIANTGKTRRLNAASLFNQKNSAAPIPSAIQKEAK